MAWEAVVVDEAGKGIALSGVRRVSQAQKARAQEDADRSTNLALIASFLAVAVGTPTTVALPPLGVGVSVAFSAWAAALGRHALVAQRVVRDPPDSKFRSAAYVAGPRFNLELLAQDNLGRASRPALADLLRSTSLSSAMIRALERAQGAALAREQTFEEQRFQRGSSTRPGSWRGAAALRRLSRPCDRSRSKPSTGSSGAPERRKTHQPPVGSCLGRPVRDGCTAKRSRRSRNMAGE